MSNPSISIRYLLSVITLVKDQGDDRLIFNILVSSVRLRGVAEIVDLYKILKIIIFFFDTSPIVNVIHVCVY